MTQALVLTLNFLISTIDNKSVCLLVVRPTRLNAQFPQTRVHVHVNRTTVKRKALQAINKSLFLLESAFKLGHNKKVPFDLTCSPDASGSFFTTKRRRQCGKKQNHVAFI